MNGFIIFPKKNNYIEIDNVIFAITKKEQSFGLMNCEVPTFMVFLYKEACLPNFWMKNTLLPLDIIFINNNIIDSIKSGNPLSEKTITPTSLTKIVIEAPLGFCKTNKIESGDKIKIKYDKEIIDKIFKTWS